MFGHRILRFGHFYSQSSVLIETKSFEYQPNSYATFGSNTLRTKSQALQIAIARGLNPYSLAKDDHKYEKKPELDFDAASVATWRRRRSL
jgi:hypothetical protein